MGPILTAKDRKTLWEVVNNRLPGLPRNVKQQMFNDLRKKIEERRREVKTA